MCKTSEQEESSSSVQTMVDLIHDKCKKNVGRTMVLHPTEFVNEMVEKCQADHKPDYWSELLHSYLADTSLLADLSESELYHSFFIFSFHTQVDGGDVGHQEFIFFPSVVASLTLIEYTEFDKYKFTYQGLPVLRLLSDPVRCHPTRNTRRDQVLQAALGQPGGLLPDLVQIVQEYDGFCSLCTPNTKRLKT